MIIAAEDSTDDVPEEDLLFAYGEPRPSSDQVIASIKRKTDFKPWHHPVKQIVRERQWAALAKKLIQDRSETQTKLRYFTLPGPDLLDVRVLAEACHSLNVKIEYFGFDVGADATRHDAPGSYGVPTWINAESALRQSGQITDDALILPDRLEDLAMEDSQASSMLRQKQTFDVVNIDACDHLAYLPKGRSHNTFDALNSILKHQMRSTSAWLLFITTRVDPELLGSPGICFQTAINQNLSLTGEFSQKLADCIGANVGRIASELVKTWSTHSMNFLKLYTVGLGKYLLQFYQFATEFAF